MAAGTLGYYFIWSYAIILGAYALIVAVCLISSVQSRLSLTYALPVLVPFAYWWTSLLWSPLREEGTQQLLFDSLFVMFSFLPLIMKRKFNDKLPIYLIFTAAVCYLLCALVAQATTGDFIDITRGSVRSLFGNYFLMGMPCATYLTFRKRSIVAGAILAGMIFVGLQIGSRTFLLFCAPLLFLSLSAIFRHSMFWSRFILPLGVISAVAGGIFFAVVPLTQSSTIRFQERELSLDLSDTLFQEAARPVADSIDVERRLTTLVGLQSFEADPIFGAGFMSTPYFVGQYSRFETTAHGLPLFLLGETGLVGTTLFVGVLLLVLLGYARYRRLPRTLEAADIFLIELCTFVATFINGLFHQMYNDPVLWLFMGIGLYRAWEARGAAARPNIRRTRGLRGFA